MLAGFKCCYFGPTASSTFYLFCSELSVWKIFKSLEPNCVFRSWCGLASVLFLFVVFCCTVILNTGTKMEAVVVQSLGQSCSICFVLFVFIFQFRGIWTKKQHSRQYFHYKHPISNSLVVSVGCIAVCWLHHDMNLTKTDTTCIMWWPENCGACSYKQI